MGTYAALAWRNLWRNHRRTLITVTSVTLAVVLAVFAKALNEGSYDQMINNMVRFHTGHVQLQDPLYEEEPSLDNAIYYDESLRDQVLGADAHIEFVVPRIETFALAAGEEQTRGTFLIGIDPGQESRLNDLPDRIVAGRMLESGDGSAVVSEGLARRLNLKVGDTLVLLGQGRFGMTAAGTFPVAGLIRHPLREMNDQLVYLSIPDAQWLLSMEDHITSLLVMPVEARRSDAVAASLGRMFADDGLRVLTWQEMMPELIQAIDLDRATGNVILGILYLIIGFGIFGTVLTMTLERLREFGMLLSIGMRRVNLGLVLAAETLLICLLGVAVGAALGYGVMYYFHLNPILFAGDAAEVIMDMGIEPYLRTSMDPGILLSQGRVVFTLAFVICLYPITKIARLNIMDAMRS
jgi:putative ABC transport system permease protein